MTAYMEVYQDHTFEQYRLLVFVFFLIIWVFLVLCRKLSYPAVSFVMHFKHSILCLIDLVVSREIGWEEHLQNEPFCVGRDVTRSINLVYDTMFRTESTSSSTVDPVHTANERQPSSTPSPRASPTISRPTPTRLLESGIVFRLEDFALYRVSSAIDERRSTPRKFVSSDKKQLLLPRSMSSVHLEFTDYYFPDDKELPGNFCCAIT